MYKAVIFDLDGTLLNTLDDLADSTNFALEKNGFPTRTIDEVRRFVGNGNIKLIHRALPDTASEAQFQKTYSDFTAQELCGGLFGDYVKTVIGSDGVRPNKPAPDGLYLALEKLGVEKKDAVFIGDSEVDIATAKNAEMDCIGVLWGFRDEKQLREIGVEKTAKNAAELQSMLLF